MKDDVSTNWLKDNWQYVIYIAALLFTLGSLYAEYQINAIATERIEKTLEEKADKSDVDAEDLRLHSAIDAVKDRQTKKIKVIYQNVNDIDALKAFHKYEQGFNDGYEKARKELETK